DDRPAPELRLPRGRRALPADGALPSVLRRGSAPRRAVPDADSEAPPADVGAAGARRGVGHAGRLQPARRAARHRLRQGLAAERGRHHRDAEDHGGVRHPQGGHHPALHGTDRHRRTHAHDDGLPRPGADGVQPARSAGALHAGVPGLPQRQGVAQRPSRARRVGRRSPADVHRGDDRAGARTDLSAARRFADALVSTLAAGGPRPPDVHTEVDVDVRRATTAGLLCLALGIAIPAPAQVETEPPPAVPGAQPVTVERIRIRGAALEGNLEGNAVEREVLVILPPSYAREPERRYPVVYALHGYSIGAEQWAKEIHVPQSIEGAFGKGAREMIVVMPDSKTLHNGSMYSASITTGNFEAFIARDVVSYIDAHYRTIPRRESRGLVGHSMGGYGASRIGMKHADVFGSLYVMSPCCLSPRAAGPADKLQALVDEAKTTEDLANLPFGLRTTLAVASAWSPNP